MSQNRANTSNVNRHSLVKRLFIYYGKIVKEFLRHTVIHGLKYLAFKYFTLLERLFFLCCLTAAFYNSFHFASILVEKWQSSPVITVKSPKTTSLWHHPFPAVTVCNMNQVQFNKVKDIEKDTLDYALLKRACFQKVNFTAYAHLKQDPENNLTNFFLKNAQNCSQMIEKCVYRKTQRTCSNLFREIFLDEGLCCTFNMVHPFFLYKEEIKFVRDYTTTDSFTVPVEWNPESGYATNLPNDFYPRRSYRSGLTNGLRIIVNGDFENYYCSSTAGPGLKVSIHNPIDVPAIHDNGLLAHLGLETNFLVQPYLEESDPILRTSTTPKQRQCYFNDEYSLIYFKFYTQHNCETECDAKYYLEKCNCIPHYMPFVSENASDCLVRQFDCVFEAEMNLNGPINRACKRKCLPSCTGLSYKGTAFYTHLDNTGFQIRNRFFRNMTKRSLEKRAALNIYFENNYYRADVRKPFIGLTEFLSQVGGIMSLMMGFSVISIVEIVYFFVVKPLMNFRYRILNRIHSAHIEKDEYNERQENNIYPVNNHGIASLNILSRAPLPSYTRSRNMTQMVYLP